MTMLIGPRIGDWPDPQCGMRTVKACSVMFNAYPLNDSEPNLDDLLYRRLHCDGACLVIAGVFRCRAARPYCIDIQQGELVCVREPSGSFWVSGTHNGGARLQELLKLNKPLIPGWLQQTGSAGEAAHTHPESPPTFRGSSTGL